MDDWRHLIVDTDFAIEILSVNMDAIDYVMQANSSLYISVVSKAELIRGAQNKTHLNRILKEIDLFTVIDLDSEVSTTFNKLMQQYTLSHRIGISDAFIAATSLTYDLPLLTCNTRHFTYISGIKLPHHGVKPQRRGFLGF